MEKTLALRVVVAVMDKKVNLPLQISQLSSNLLLVRDKRVAAMVAAVISASKLHLARTL